MTVATGRELQFEEVGRRVVVDENPVSRIMYYMGCVRRLTTLDIPQRFVDFDHPEQLSGEEVVALFLLATQLSPNALIEVGLVHIDQRGEICRDSQNRFFKVTDTQVAAFANSEVVIGAQRVNVVQIMFCLPKWIDDYYDTPIEQFLRILHRAEASDPLLCPSRKTSDCCCLLL
jgi:hypothetical protein